jgi:PAS domain S-box-containing protein
MKFSPPKLNVLFFTFGAITFLIMVALYALTYRQITNTLRSSGKLIHYNKVELELEKINGLLRQAETAQRGYLITHDTSFLIPYQQARIRLNHCFYKLDSLLKNDPDQLEKLNELYLTTQKRFLLLRQNIKLAEQSPEFSDTLRLHLDSGIKIMAQSNRIARDMIQYEDLKLSRLERAHRDQILHTPLIYLVIFLFTLVIFFYAFFKMYKDKRKLRQVNDEMKIMNETYLHAEKLADLGHWRLNLQDKTTIYSDNFYRILGLEPEDEVPRLRQFLKFVHPGDCKKVLESFKRAFRQHQVFLISYRINRKDGKLRHFKSIGRVITDDYQNKHFVGINMDVTDLVISSNLLEAKNKKLEGFNADLASFNYAASHELQAPLRKIQMFISRINEIEVNNLSSQGIEYFTRIQVSAAHMQTLINDLLLFSRTTANAKKFELCDLNEIFANALDELVSLIEEKKPFITTDNLPKTKAIPYQIQQLFINLLGNSLKFVDKDVIPTIHVSCDIVKYDTLNYEDAFTSEKYYKIIFKDNGIGFEPEYAKRIFHLLFRLHDKVVYPGTGIGLAICKKIVDNHNGYIEAKSELGKGAEFSIFLPITNPT